MTPAASDVEVSTAPDQGAAASLGVGEQYESSVPLIGPGEYTRDGVGLAARGKLSLLMSVVHAAADA